MTFLETKNLSKTYSNGVKAVDALNMELDRGEVYGLIGPNGAGKSTTIRMLMGILTPDSGKILFEGSEGVDLSRVGYLPEGVNFYSFMRVKEYLRWACDFYQVGEPQMRVEEALRTVGLEGLEERKLDEVSKGQKQRVGIAQALVHQPDLIVLDEPTSGLDPIGKKKILEIISSLARRGKTILTSSHILPELSQVCTAVGIIRGGNLLLQGGMDELREKFSTSNVELRFESVEEGLIDKISSSEFIKSVEETDGEGLSFRLTVRDEAEAKRKLPRLLSSSDSILTYYDFAHITLEDIFMETLEGEKR